MCCSTRISPRDGLKHLVDDAAVPEEHHPIGIDRGRRIVGDHHDGLPEVRHGPAQESQDLTAGAGIQVAGWFVGKHDVRCRSERSGRGHPLLLSTRELGGPKRQAVPEPHGIDDRVNPIPVGAPAGQGAVLSCSKCWHQVKRLKDEPDLIPS